MNEHPSFVGLTKQNADEKAPAAAAIDPAVEEEQVRRLAARYRLPFVDLARTKLDQELLHVLPVELMVQYRFVPLGRDGEHALHLAVADPSGLDKIDEVRSRLRARLRLSVATPSAIDAVLSRGDASQRVLDEATEHLRVSLVKETEQGEEALLARSLARSFVWSN